jgi:uncharacterized membrane protein
VLAQVLTPLTKLLDLLVTKLTAVLGISLANAEVWLNGVDCNNAELVY